MKQKFQNIHSRVFNTKLDDVMHKKVFWDNLNFIKSHNAKFAQGLVSYSMNINRFADLVIILF